LRCAVISEDHDYSTHFSGRASDRAKNFKIVQ
jgi:hypothetical protein